MAQINRQAIYKAMEKAKTQKLAKINEDRAVARNMQKEANESIRKWMVDQLRDIIRDGLSKRKITLDKLPEELISRNCCTYEANVTNGAPALLAKAQATARETLARLSDAAESVERESRILEAEIAMCVSEVPAALQKRVNDFVGAK